MDLTWWNEAKEWLSQSWLGNLIDLSKLVGSGLALIGSVFAWVYRKAVKAFLLWFSRKLRPWRQKFYASIGIATLDDLEAIKSSGIPKSNPATSAPPGPRTIERYGVKFRLDPSIEEYLGKIDPMQVAAHTIDSLIQGPFCSKCSYTLVDWRQRLGEYYVANECPRCGHPWKAKNSDRATLSECKKVTYQDLDAEFSRDGGIAPGP